MTTRNTLYYGDNLSVQELLDGAKIKMPPPSTATTFKRAEASKGESDSQMRLDL